MATLRLRPGVANAFGPSRRRGVRPLRGRRLALRLDNCSICERDQSRPEILA
jgi:hypothetical protein